MATLYEIDEALLECVDMETGEILDEERLDALTMDREKKIENTLCFIKNLRSDAASMREEEKALAERRRAAERLADGLAVYVGRSLNGQKWSSPRAQATWRKSTAVQIIDEAETLEWCEEHAEEAIKYAAPTLDKTVLKDLMKAGVLVAGSVLVERNNIQIK